MAVFSWRVSILQRPHLGDELPDQKGISDRQLTSDPAIGNNAGKARSWGPFPDMSSVKIENHPRLQESGRREPEHRAEGSAQMR